AGRFVMISAYIVLMVEYSLARKIPQEDLCLSPGVLIKELSEMNPLTSVFLNKHQAKRYLGERRIEKRE
ncbi:MAG: hypothetical protein KAU14_02800, partial [Thermoplasmata archaeon]|nr:hypothetical protein [Thermoplasmata archaeon]